MPFVEANGERLFYVREGDGPVVLLIHSLGANTYIWRDQIAALSDRYSCIAFDLRGHGETSYNGTFTVDDVAADLAAGLAALGVESCHVVAMAMGGPIALALNARLPGTVRSLAFIASFVDKSEGAEDRIYATQEALAYLSMIEFGRQYANDRLMPETPMEALDELADSVGKVPPEAYLDTIRAVLLPDFSSYLAKVEAPTLVVLGDRDTVTPLPHSQAIVTGIAGATLKMIEGAGHLPNLDMPDAVNAALGEFLDAQPGGG